MSARINGLTKKEEYLVTSIGLVTCQVLKIKPYYVISQAPSTLPEVKLAKKVILSIVYTTFKMKYSQYDAPRVYIAVRDYFHMRGNEYLSHCYRNYMNSKPFRTAFNEVRMALIVAGFSIPDVQKTAAIQRRERGF